MTESASLATRVCAVMADVGNVEKDKTNDHFKYSYVSAEAVRAKVQKACAKHGVMLKVQYEQETVTPQQSVLKATCSVSIDGATWVLLGEGWGAGVDRGEKSPMKACTSAAKYAIANAFCIALGDDPEADAETDKAAAKRPEKAPVKREERTAEPTQDSRVVGALTALLACKSDVELRAWLAANSPLMGTLPQAAKRELWSSALRHGATIGLDEARMKALSVEAAAPRSGQVPA